MKKTYTLALFAAASAMAAAAFMTDTRTFYGPSAAEMNTSAGTFDPAKAASFVISSADKSVTLKRIEGRWKVVERGNAQADTAYVADFLNAAASIRPLKEMKADTPEALKELGLTEDSQDHVTAEFFDDTNKSIYKFELGGAHYKKESEQLAGLQVRAPDARYVAITDQNGEKHVFMISRIFMKCGSSPSVWIEPMRLASLAEPLHMRYLAPGKDGKILPVWWVMRSASETDSYVFVHPAEGTVKVSLPKLSELLKALSAPFSINILPPEAAEKFTPTGVFQAVFLNGFTYDLEFQTQEASPVAYARLSVKFDPEKTRRIQGESQEDFDNRKKQLGQRAEFEKATYTNRVFVVRAETPAMAGTIPAK